MDVLILAAGYATRLGDLTRDTPKPLLEVGDRAMLEHILDKVLVSDRVRRILVVTNARFAGHFERWAAGWPADLPPVTVIDDGTSTNETRLGANGDIRFAIERAGVEDDLLVVGGDNLFSFDLQSFLEFASARDAATVLKDVGSRELARLYGVVALDGDRRITSFVEKPADPPSTLISTCIYYYARRHLDLFRRYLDEGNDKDRTGSFLQWAHEKVPVYGWTAAGDWWDIGDPEELARVRAIFSAPAEG